MTTERDQRAEHALVEHGGAEPYHGAATDGAPDR